jgi:hypothetical protein
MEYLADHWELLHVSSVQKLAEEMNNDSLCLIFQSVLKEIENDYHLVLDNEKGEVRSVGCF